MTGDRRRSVTPARGGEGPFAELFLRAGRAYGLDPALLWAVAMTESSLDPRAVSPVGAMGLMQLMPGTARLLGCADPFDPAQNVDAGARYLRQLLDQFGDVALALAAYNAGPHVVERYGGIPPYRETVAYVEKVQRLWREVRERWVAGEVVGEAAGTATGCVAPPAAAGAAAGPAPAPACGTVPVSTDEAVRIPAAAGEEGPVRREEPPPGTARQDSGAAAENPPPGGAREPGPGGSGLTGRLLRAWGRWRRRNA